MVVGIQIVILDSDWNNDFVVVVLLLLLCPLLRLLLCCFAFLFFWLATCALSVCMYACMHVCVCASLRLQCKCTTMRGDALDGRVNR